MSELMSVQMSGRMSGQMPVPAVPALPSLATSRRGRFPRWVPAGALAAVLAGLLGDMTSAVLEAMLADVPPAAAALLPVSLCVAPARTWLPALGSQPVLAPGIAAVLLTACARSSSAASAASATAVTSVCASAACSTPAPATVAARPARRRASM
eukprot:365647-Chlamydomonas_euryale.AAC.17